MSQIVDHSRRQFFRLKKPEDTPLRPPWSLPESDFLDLCQRCNQCVSSCQSGPLIVGSGGYPEADFNKAGCTFCGDCADACKTGALQRNGRPAFQSKPQVQQNCLAQQKVHCRTCSEMCDEEAISFHLSAGSVATPDIDSDQCTGCGECVSACPVDAITMRPENTHEPKR